MTNLLFNQPEGSGNASISNMTKIHPIIMTQVSLLNCLRIQDNYCTNSHVSALLNVAHILSTGVGLFNQMLVRLICLSQCRLPVNRCHKMRSDLPYYMYECFYGFSRI